MTKKENDNKALGLALLLFLAVRGLFALKMPDGGGGAIPGGGSGDVIDFKKATYTSQATFNTDDGDPVEILLVNPFLVKAVNEPLVFPFASWGSYGVEKNSIHKVMGFSQDGTWVLMDYYNRDQPHLFLWNDSVKNQVRNA